MPDGLEFLAEKGPHEPRRVYAVSGDEPFLKQLILERLRKLLLTEDDANFALSTLDGEEIEWRDLLDELSTVAMFGGDQRLIIVRDADDFVSKHRAQLEDYVAKPKSTGRLVLELRSFPSNTRLYKSVQASGLVIDGGVPSPASLQKWAIHWAKHQHNVKIEKPAAELLLEIVGPQMGRIDQELAKLAARVGPEGSIDEKQVEELVAGKRARQVWDMLDAMLAGNASDALGQLERLILSGEEPIGLLAQMGSNLRRLAAAARIFDLGERTGRRLNLRAALEAVGVKSFVLAKTEDQLKQVGRQRATQIYDWLIEADLALKGASSHKLRARFELEELICRLSKAADPRHAGSA